ncbi:bestrophin family protein [Amorphus coralli]|uniref:bestrophin family protein n=1 Tax=Amorphus coralli TaxID=340680 RepID=UPI000382318D|nr:bestrophin family ion channel [Amorphus coralli]
MYVRGGIGGRDVFWDSWKVVLIAGVWAALVVAIRVTDWLPTVAVPRGAVSTMGIVVSVYLGFKSSSAYARWWEARTIWGAIINDSRAWANAALSFVAPTAGGGEAASATLIRRHLAWVNAVAHQLRRTSVLKISPVQHVFDYRRADTGEIFTASPDGYRRHLSENEAAEVARFANPAVHIARHQGAQVNALLQSGALDNNRAVALMAIQERLIASQGACERLKNTPFPRQITYFGRIFTWIFIILIPLGSLDAFIDEVARHLTSPTDQDRFVLLLIPFTIVVSWLFYMVEKVSESCENPFEWGSTDVPIAALTRTIEIDLLEMLGDDSIPAPLKPRDGVLY